MDSSHSINPNRGEGSVQFGRREGKRKEVQGLIDVGRDFRIILKASTNDRWMIPRRQGKIS